MDKLWVDKVLGPLGPVLTNLILDLTGGVAPPHVPRDVWKAFEAEDLWYDPEEFEDWDHYFPGCIGQGSV